MNDYAVRLLAEMLNAYSPSGSETAMADLLSREMKRLGFSVRKDDVGNVIGEIGSGKPVVLLCGHMDTVEGKIRVRNENGRMFGRGAVDAKSSLAAMIVAASLFASGAQPYKIVVAGVVEEESTSKGVNQIVKSCLQPDYAVFGEPSGVDKITIGYKGSMRLSITCETKTGHSSAPRLFENAIERGYELWTAIRETHLEKERTDSHFYSISYSLIRISGGKRSSTIPSRCHLDIDIRFPPQISSHELYSAISDTVKEYQTKRPMVMVKVKVEDTTEPFEVDPHSVLVRTLSASIRSVRHRNPVLLRKTGTGDMNLLGREMKIPVVTYGPGDSHLDHTSNESIGIKDYLDSIEIYREVLERLAVPRKNLS
jgi:LysW-gamma-L-lysine carboxypeptidase